MIEFDLLDALLRTMRALACITGALVIVDSIGILLTYPERPPHRPRANAAAWLVGSVVVSAASAWLLYIGHGWVGEDAPLGAKIAITAHWAGLAVAFTARAVTRAHRPGLVIASAVLMGLFGTLLALVDGSG